MLQKLLSVLFCKRCGICSRVIPQEEEICPLCKADLPLMGSNLCPFCGRERKNCLCDPAGFAFDGASAPLYYTEKARHLIHQFKFYEQKELAPLLASLMEERVREVYSQERFDLVIPVPMHAKEHQERKYNQSVLLARELAKRLRIPFRETILQKIRETKRQRTLEGEERRENLKNAFAVSSGTLVEGKVILLVDDVLTTGSTANECARTLKLSGARQVFCVTCCATVLEKAGNSSHSSFSPREILAKKEKTAYNKIL